MARKAPKPKTIKPESIPTPADLQRFSERDLRKEVSRMRAVAVKRLNRFKDTIYEESSVYMQNQGLYKKLSEMQSREEVRAAAYKLRDFIRKKSNTLLSEREHVEHAVAELNKQSKEQGREGVEWTPEKYLDFMRFMDKARGLNAGLLLDSSQELDFFIEHMNETGSFNDLLATYEKWREEGVASGRYISEVRTPEQVYRKVQRR